MAVKVGHIDGERRGLRVEQAKGAKDRQVMISASLLQALRGYWRHYRPATWLFSGRDPCVALSVTSAQKVFLAAKRRTGIEKVGGIHSLRHAYATHQLAAGMPVHVLERALGHTDLRTTQRYVHWVPGRREDSPATDLLAGLEVAP